MKHFKITTAIASIVLATNVFAEAEGPIEEIIVTSEKLGRSLKDTTTSVTVVTGTELEERSIDDLYDVVTRTANVGQSFGEKGFNIRGIDQRGAGGGTGLLINTTVDGASLPSNQSTFFGPYSTWDIAQVEILRGPQGTSQGRNAIGGTIIINSADPILNSSEMKVRASIAERETYQIAAAKNFAVNDEFALRFSVDKHETDGWVYNPTRDEDYDARDSLTLRAKALWQPSDDLKLKWTTNYTDSIGGEDSINFLEFPEFRRNFSNLPAEEGSEHLINTLQIDYALNDNWDLTSITTHYDHEYLRIEDIDGTALDLGFLQRSNPDSSLSTELRFKYDNGDKIRAVTGIYYGDFELDSNDVGELPVTIVVPAKILVLLGIDPRTAKITRTADTSSTENNLAVFGELEYDLSDKLTLIAGLRIDREQRKSNRLQTTRTNISGQLPIPLPPDTTQPLDTDFDAVLPKLGLRYDISDSVTLGLVAQSAYRAGGQIVSAVTNTVSDFDPEEAWNYEASLRADLNDQYQISANLFYTDWKDQQVSRPTDISIQKGFNSDFITVNAGKSRLYGAELSVDARWNDQWSGFASIGLLNTKYIDFVSGLIDNSGNEFAYAPSSNVSLGLNYRHPDGYVAIADLNWCGDQFSSSQNNADGQIDSYALANLKIGYEADNWSIFAFGRNLFDEDYMAQIFNGTFRNGQIIRQQGRSGEPRLVGVELNFRFGD